MFPIENRVFDFTVKSGNIFHLFCFLKEIFTVLNLKKQKIKIN